MKFLSRTAPLAIALVAVANLGFAPGAMAEKARPTRKPAQKTSRRADTRMQPAAKQPSKQARTVSSSPEVEAPTQPMASTSYQAMSGSSPRFLFSSGFGVQVLSKPGLALQSQLLFAVGKKREYLIGPDFTYTLFAPGNALTVGLGGWYDLKIYGAPRLSCLFGLIAGPVFNSAVTGFSNTSYAVLFDLALVQEVDDLISVKGQFRPGILGSAFTYVMSFQVAFRFI